MEKAIAETIAVADGAASAASIQLTQIAKLTSDLTDANAAIEQKADKSVVDEIVSKSLPDMQAQIDSVAATAAENLETQDTKLVGAIADAKSGVEALVLAQGEDVKANGKAATAAATAAEAATNAAAAAQAAADAAGGALVGLMFHYPGKSCAAINEAKGGKASGSPSLIPLRFWVNSRTTDGGTPPEHTHGGDEVPPTVFHLIR